MPLPILQPDPKAIPTARRSAAAHPITVDPLVCRYLIGHRNDGSGSASRVAILTVFPVVTAIAAVLAAPVWMTVPLEGLIAVAVVGYAAWRAAVAIGPAQTIRRRAANDNSIRPMLPPFVLEC